MKRKKRANEARKKQKVIEVKEIKLRPNIDEHDYQVKMRSVQKVFGFRRQGQGNITLSWPRDGASGFGR